jgi:hypothetical protein
MTHPNQLYGEADLKLAGLSIWALNWEFPASDDYWDANWINIHARVEAHGARVDAAGPLLTSVELRSLRDQLLALNHDLKGTAELACIEPNLSATLSCDVLGHIEVVVQITPDHLTQAHRFDFTIDQSYLGPVITGCNRVLERFPVRGFAQPGPLK